MGGCRRSRGRLGGESSLGDCEAEISALSQHQAWEAQTQRSSSKMRRKSVEKRGEPPRGGRPWGGEGDPGDPDPQRSCLGQGHAALRSIPGPASPPASPCSFHSICIIISSILSQEKQTSPSLPTTRRGGEGVAGPDNKAAGVGRSCKEIIDM